MSRTINELNTTDTIVDADKFVIWQNTSQATRAITAADMADYFSLAGGPYQPSDELLTSIAALGPTTTADRMIYTTAQDVAALTPITAFGRSLMDDANQAAGQTTLGYTAADVLAKLITVDGAGSNLDADLLDGVQGSAYAQLGGATFTGLVVLPETGPTSTLAAGFRGAPVNRRDANYTLVLADAGKSIVAFGAGGHTWTIPANASVAYPIGTVITFWNAATLSVSIAITTDTMYLSPGGTTGTRTLAQWGTARLLKVDSTAWTISGTGLT